MLGCRDAEEARGKLDAVLARATEAEAQLQAASSEKAELERLSAQRSAFLESELRQWRERAETATKAAGSAEARAELNAALGREATSGVSSELRAAHAKVWGAGPWVFYVGVYMCGGGQFDVRLRS